MQNTSRFRNCYSDFPVRDAWPFGGRTDFPPAYLTQADSAFYLEQYARNFDLFKHVQFGLKVTDLDRDVSDRQWELKVQNVDSGEAQARSYDKVIVATGQHHDPMKPHIEGIEFFRGPALHAASFKRFEIYSGEEI